MNESLPPNTPPKMDDMERALRDQLDRIRHEDTPERLLHLARHLQELLRQRSRTDPQSSPQSGD